MNLWTYVNILVTLCIEECRFIINKIALSSFDEINVTFSDCTFTYFSVSSPAGDKMSSEGQAFSGYRNHSGLFHQNSWSNKSAAANPLEAQSAGLSSVGTYFQLLAGIISCIFATRLATNVFHFLG